MIPENEVQLCLGLESLLFSNTYFVLVLFELATILLRLSVTSNISEIVLPRKFTEDFPNIGFRGGGTLLFTLSNALETDEVMISSKLFREKAYIFFSLRIVYEKDTPVHLGELDASKHQ